MPRLGIMRCSYDVAFELITQDLCVASLGAPRHRLSHIRESLMTVESAQLNHLSIQLKSMICKLRLAKTKPPAIFVENLSASQEADPHRIKVPMFKVP